MQQQIKKVKTQAFKNRLRGHKDGVITLHAPGGPESSYLYSASKDGSLRIWNLEQKKMEKKLFVSRIENEILEELKQDDIDEYEEEEEEEEQKNDKYVENVDQFLQNQNNTDSDHQFSCAVFSENCLYAGYSDGNIFSWGIVDGKIAQVLIGHIDKVTGLEFLNNRQLVSISADFTVRIWDVMIGQNEYVYKLPGPVTQLRTDGSVIHVIVSKNSYYCLDAQTHKITKSIKFANTIITSFILHENLLILGTINNQMEIYDIEDYDEEDIQPKKIIEGIDGWVLSMKIFNNYLYVGGDDRKIRVWNIEKDFRNDDNLEGHRDGVISLEFAGGMLYTGSFDHSIRNWDLDEMFNRIRERQIMYAEDLWSKKHDAYYTKLHSRKKKKKKGKKGKKKK